MLGIKKMKEEFLAVVKEHYSSEACLLVGLLLWAIEVGFRYDSPKSKYFLGAAIIFIGIAACLLYCETYHLYCSKVKENYSFRNPKTLLSNGIIVFIGTVISAAVGFVYIQSEEKDNIFGKWEDVVTQLTNRTFMVYITIVLITSVYYYFRISELSFETYTAKVFLGLVKAEVAYGIIAVGFLLIVFAFDTLIFRTGSLSERIQVMLLGIVEFPCVVMAFSRIDEGLSKFAKIILNYVFPGLLAIAFLIVYIYIVKILVKWEFPSNEVFAILTGLFCAGLPIWIMAQGVEDGGLKEAFKYLPLLYIPFIALQSMSVGMRISQYGLTPSRYAGVALIIFEIVYFVIYIAGVTLKKQLSFLLLFMVIATVFLTVFMPGTSYRDVVIASQKKRIETYLASNAPTTQQVHDAYEAYKTIKYDCGFEGERYVEKTLTEDQIDQLKESDGNYKKPKDPALFDMTCPRDEKMVKSLEFDKDYSKIVFVSAYNKKYDSDTIPMNDVDLKVDDDKFIKVDLTQKLKKWYELEQNGAEDGVIRDFLVIPVETKDGGMLYITDISAEGNIDKEEFTYFSLDGFVLY